MKLRTDQLPAHLKNSLNTLYIVSGDEPLLVKECGEQIKAAALSSGFTNQQRCQVDKSFDWHDLLQFTQNGSLFGDRNLIEINLGGSKPDDKGKAFLQHFAQQKDPDNLVILNTGKLDASAQRSKWFKTLENNGVFIQIWPIDSHKLPAWINQRMRAAGLKPSQAAVQIIADKIEGNLLAAVQEIEKLRLIHGPGNIDEEGVLAAVSDNSRYNIFQLIETAQLGNTGKALKILKGLRQEGNEPTLILWAFSRELRTMAAMAQQLEEGIAIGRIFQEHRIWDKRKPPLQACLKRLNYKALLKLIQDAHQTDLAIKGLLKNDPWLNFSHLVLEISGKGLH